MISILKDKYMRVHGFKILLKRGCFYNIKIKKVFSFEYIEKNDIQTITSDINRPNEKNEWEIYFINTLKDSQRQQLLTELELIKGV